MPIDKLNHYSITNPSTIYDEEALTALELAGRTASKVNEVVDFTNKSIEEIPNVVAKDVQNHIKDGTFDKQIDEHTTEVQKSINKLDANVDELDKRVSNLLGSVTEGSTTGDAELIDARMAIDGVTYPSAGDATRKQTKRVSSTFCFLNGTPKVTWTTSRITVTLPLVTHICVYGRNYVITDATATFTHSDTKYFWLTFDYISNTIAIQYYTAEIPNTAVIIGQIYKDRLTIFGDLKTVNRTDADSSHNFYAMCFCDKPPYTVKDSAGNAVVKTNAPIYVYFGKKYYNELGNLNVTIPTATSESNLFHIYVNLATGEFISEPSWKEVTNEYVYIGTYHRYIGPMMNDIDKDRFKPVTPCALILGDPTSRQYIEFDSKNKTVTIPADTLIMFDGATGSPINYHVSIPKRTVVSYADKNSSALKVIYDSINQTVNIKYYSEPCNPNTEYVIAVFRTTGSVSINAPFKWDGKPYNIDPDSINGNISVQNVEYNVKSIAHRGYSSEAPENTLASIRKAAEKGFKYVEFDVQITANGEAILMHDNTIDRTTNGTGDTLTTDVTGLDAGSWFSPAFAGEKVPTLREALKLCRQLGLHPYVELKRAYQNFNSLELELIRDIVLENGYGKLTNGIADITFISFNHSVLDALQTSASIKIAGNFGYLYDDFPSDITKVPVSANKFIDVGSNADFDTFIVNFKDYYKSKSSIYFPHVETWTVNNETALLNLPSWVCGVTSDSLHAGKVLYNHALNTVTTNPEPETPVTPEPEPETPVTPSTIEFSVDGIAYSVENGKTWADWVGTTNGVFMVVQLAYSTIAKVIDASFFQVLDPDTNKGVYSAYAIEAKDYILLT